MASGFGDALGRFQGFLFHIWPVEKSSIWVATRDHSQTQLGFQSVLGMRKPPERPATSEVLALSLQKQAMTGTGPFWALASVSERGIPGRNCLWLFTGLGHSFFENV